MQSNKNKNETPHSRNNDEDVLEVLMNWLGEHQYEQVNAYLEAHPHLPAQLKQVLKGMVLLSNFRVTSEFTGKKNGKKK